MAEDFRVKIEADLNTEQADQKIEKLINKKRTIKLDVDINGQNAKSIKVCFLLGCTKAQANLWPNLQEFFGKNHEEQLVLAD